MSLLGRLAFPLSTQLIPEFHSQEIGRLGLHPSQPQGAQFFVRELITFADVDFLLPRGVLGTIVKDDLIGFELTARTPCVVFRRCHPVPACHSNRPIDLSSCPVGETLKSAFVALDRVIVFARHHQRVGCRD